MRERESRGLGAQRGGPQCKFATYAAHMQRGKNLRPRCRFAEYDRYFAESICQRSGIPCRVACGGLPKLIQ